MLRCPNIFFVGRRAYGHGASHPCSFLSVRMILDNVDRELIVQDISFLNANPKNSKWFNRDRFVLSNG